MRILSAALGMAALMAAGAEAASLAATAGVGGVARPGRWTPVRITVTSDAPGAGDLVAAWGDAAVRRRLMFDSPGTKQVELHLRTSDVEASVRIRFENGDAATTAIAVPIRVLRDDERFELCVTPESAAAVAGVACTVTLAAADLPRSARGLEAVDHVTWPLGRSRTGAEQAAALGRWDALKRLDASGDLSLAPQPARPSLSRALPVATGRGVLAVGALCLAVLLAAGRACTTRPRRVGIAAAGLGAAVAAACAAALALGRVGPTRPVTVHYQSVLQQIPGTDAALLSMRGVAELPARGTIALRLPVADGTIEPSTAEGRAHARMDADGYPVLEAAGGLGARRAFEAEAVVTESWLSIDDSGASLRITNRSPYTMDTCRLAAGLSTAGAGALPPGGMIEARRDTGAELLGPVILCTTQAPSAALTEDERPVIMRGSTVVAAFLAPRAAGEDVP